MKEKDFQELKESIIEVGLMMRGELEPSREFAREKPTTQATEIETWAICLTNDDDDLIPMKVYKIVVRPKNKTAKVKDENGETLICPAEYFLPLDFSSEVVKLLEAQELAIA